MRLSVSFLAAALVCVGGEVKLGKPLELKSPMTVAEVNAKAPELTGKAVQVKGKVTEVCQMMGCWMQLVDGNGSAIRIKVNDGDIVFPKDAPGKMAIAEGTVSKLELTREQAVNYARHEAEEQGRKFDPAKVKGPITIYQIRGTGAVLLD